MIDLPVNINVNPAVNGWIVFVTPKFIENSGDRAYVASNVKQLEDVVGCLSQNICPYEKETLVWPYVPESGYA